MSLPLNFGDLRFAEPGFQYDTEPNAFLVEQAKRLASVSTVLVPGDGEGRNGVWLACHHLAQGLKRNGYLILEAFHPGAPLGRSGHLVRKSRAPRMGVCDPLGGPTFLVFLAASPRIHCVRSYSFDSKFIEE